MNPDVASVIPELERSGILTRAQAAWLLRISRGDLISLLPELRLLMYAGVLLVTAGVGLLVKENYGRIGPLAISIGIAAAALLCLVWAAKVAPPFSWLKTAPPSAAFEYVVLLGALLAGVDLAFLETQFEVLGARWPHHLLALSLFASAVAIRFDSIMVFSLALSTFAAWRGLSTAALERSIWSGSGDLVRWNALACGLLFVALGFVMKRHGKKPHFEPAAVHVGWLLMLVALWSGGLARGALGYGFGAALLLVGAVLARHSFERRRFGLFAYGALAVYVAVSLLVLDLVSSPVLISLWFIASAGGAVFFLRSIQQNMREQP